MVASALWPRIGAAQSGRRIPKVAVLWHAGSAEEEGPYYTVLQQAFKDLGYEEGRTIALEHRFPNEEPAKFNSMAVDLVAWGPDVLLAANVSSATAAKMATSTIPIVFIVVPDPVGSKLVDNLARPSGNLTGLSNFAVEITKKRLEFLKAAIPSLNRVALLVNPSVPSSRRYIDESEAASSVLGLTIQPFEASTLDDIDRAFDAMVTARMQALSINPEGLYFQYRNAIGQSIASHRMPTCVFSRETMVGGALMSYGPDHRDLFRRAAILTDKLLKGAKPSDLPVELPGKIEFVINNKVAKQLGISIPRSLLLRADEVIE
jgi:putative ABC transport system substrate-binding protein